MSSKWGGPCTGSTSSSSDPIGGPSTSITTSCPIYSSGNWSLNGTGTATASSDGITPSVGVGVTFKF